MCVCAHAKSCLTLWEVMHFSPPGSSVYRILQARILERIAIPFSRGSSQPTQVSCIDRRILYPLSHQGSPEEPMPSWYVRLLFPSGTVFSKRWLTPNSLPETEWNGLKEFHTLADLSIPPAIDAQTEDRIQPSVTGFGAWALDAGFGAKTAFSTQADGLAPAPFLTCQIGLMTVPGSQCSCDRSDFGHRRQFRASCLVDTQITSAFTSSLSSLFQLASHPLYPLYSCMPPPWSSAAPVACSLPCLSSFIITFQSYWGTSAFWVALSEGWMGRA